MKKPIFTGSSVAIVTPFDKDGVNLKEFARLVDFQIENGIDSITVCGTTGENPTLSTFEIQELISFCIFHVAGRVPVIAGVGGNNTSEVLKMASFASKEGADALLCVTPYYNKTSQDGLIRHFSAVADKTDTPIILYNVPSRTGMNIAPKTYFQLSKHPNINGTKDASNDFSKLLETISLCGDNLNVWSGNDDTALPLISMGAKGVISVFANICPDISSSIMNLALMGNFKDANTLNYQYLKLINSLFDDINPIPIKKALELLGYKTHFLRAPLYPMQEFTTLQNNMKDLNLI